jgi:hypothetical protein
MVVSYSYYYSNDNSIIIIIIIMVAMDDGDTISRDNTYQFERIETFVVTNYMDVSVFASVCVSVSVCVCVCGCFFGSVLGTSYSFSKFVPLCGGRFFSRFAFFVCGLLFLVPWQLAPVYGRTVTWMVPFLYGGIPCGTTITRRRRRRRRRQRRIVEFHKHGRTTATTATPVLLLLLKKKNKTTRRRIIVVPYLCLFHCHFPFLDKP